MGEVGGLRSLVDRRECPAVGAVYGRLWTYRGRETGNNKEKGHLPVTRTPLVVQD